MNHPEPYHPEKKFYSEFELENFNNLSNIYNNLPFFYCDFPIIAPDDINKFVEIFNQYSAVGVRTGPCFHEPWSKNEHPLKEKSSWYDPFWQVLDMYIDPELPEGFGHEIMASNYKNLKKEFPNFYQQIFDLFPFRKIWSIKFLKNNREILPHRDTDWNFNLPTSFRSMIYDENIEPTFYLKALENQSEKFINLPDGLNTFAYNNGNFLHGAKYHGKSKILMVIRGYLDFAKYRILLEKSLTVNQI
jgi:hypothetical protein